MNWTRFLLWDALITFTALTGYAVYEVGYLGFFELAVANWATRVLFLDLVIALSLITVWMARDARERHGSATAITPYAIVTLLFGAAGPLLYLIQRERQPHSPPKLHQATHPA